MTMKVRDEGLIEDYEYWTAERIANDMAEKAGRGNANFTDFFTGSKL